MTPPAPGRAGGGDIPQMPDIPDACPACGCRRYETDSVLWAWPPMRLSDGRVVRGDWTCFACARVVVNWVSYRLLLWANDKRAAARRDAQSHCPKAGRPPKAREV